MTLQIAADPQPLHANADGVILVGNTRVPLDTVVNAYERGSSAEEIAHQYTALPLSDIYSAIAYYLRHRSEVTTYLREREQRAAVIRQENEVRFPPDGLRERLLARRAANETAEP